MKSETKCVHCGTSLAADAPHGLCPACLMARALFTGSGSQLPAENAPEKCDPPVPADLAAHFPTLEILQLIGRGGMGAVYKARQKQLDRLVALKILPGSIGKDPSFADRFEREAKVLAKLSHPNIVTLYEFGQADGLFYFLMEYVDGVNLGHLLKAGSLSAKEALAIVPPICEALQYAHDHGIVHRDIKPGNILLSKGGQVKIADFGVAKILANAAQETASATTAPAGPETQAGHVVGTPQYMAPEQVSRPREVDHRADIYSLGVVFYQMLTGELPKGPLPLPSRKVQIDVRLDEVVLRAMEKDPERRYQQANEVKTIVETIVATTPPKLPPPVIETNQATSSKSTPSTESKSMPTSTPPNTPPNRTNSRAPFVLFWTLFFTVFVLVFLSVATATFLQVETYSSTARVVVRPDTTDLANKQLGTGNGTSLWLQDQIEILRSSAILNRVVVKLNLSDRYSKRYSAPDQPLRTNETYLFLLKNVSFAPSPANTLIDIKAFSEDRQEAADIANQIAEAYRDFHRENHVELAAAKVTLETWRGKLDEKEKEIQNLQAQVDKMRKDLALNDIDPESGKMVGTYDLDTIRGIERTRIEAEAEYVRFNELYSQLKDKSREELKRDLPTANPDPILQSLLEKLTEAEQKKAALEPDYSTNHPEMIRVTKVLVTLNQMVDDRLKGTLAGLSTRVSSFQKEANDLKAKVEAAMNKERIAAENFRPYLKAKADLETQRQTKQALSLRVDQASVDVQKAAAIASAEAVRVIDRAEPSLRPARPNKPLNLTIGIISGLVLGFIAGGLGWLIASRRRG